MEQVTTRSWRAEFARSAAYRREQDRFFKETEKRLKDDRKVERLDDDLADLATVAVLASDEDLAEFQITLDAYDAATVEALMENEQQLEAVRERINAMLSEAYVLPDGRRVFKSKDGQRVFDEHGQELSPQEIDPNLIEEWRPRHEDFAAEIRLQDDLTDERDTLLRYQEKLDEARARIEGDDVTKQDIADIRADLDASMPIGVREIARPDTMPERDMRQDFAAATRHSADMTLDNDLSGMGFDR